MKTILCFFQLYNNIFNRTCLPRSSQVSMHQIREILQLGTYAEISVVWVGFTCHLPYIDTTLCTWAIE